MISSRVIRSMVVFAAILLLFSVKSTYGGPDAGGAGIFIKPFNIFFDKGGQGQVIVLGAGKGPSFLTHHELTKSASGAHIQIEKLLHYSETSNKKSVFEMAFHPGLPLSFGKTKEDNRDGVFRISMDEFKDLVTGTFRLEYPNPNTISLLVTPVTEMWKTKAFSVQMTREGDRFLVKRQFTKN
jgi:hypothetical protein